MQTGDAKAASQRAVVRDGCSILPARAGKGHPLNVSAADVVPLQAKKGAGVIPFAVSGGTVHFLFQITFSGRKTGYLIDFGGGVAPGEEYRETAVREFVEETETMYFADDVSKASRSVEAVAKQIPLVTGLFEKTLSANPHWCCMRVQADPGRPKDWRSFFIEFPYRDVEPLNREWEADTIGRFKKRRQLVWIAAHELLDIYQNTPDRLWKRVRELENPRDIIRDIRLSKVV